MPKKKKDSDRTTIMFCVPADFPFTVRGATFDQRCSGCNVHVILSPAGKEALQTTPNMKLLCIRCAALAFPDEVLAGPLARVHWTFTISSPTPGKERN